ncbi:MAG: cysteine peptidase family C39 domain-containing protein, partial [Pseudomonadota bacterium]|nr:cysteine peptidase family C39 domain-containing protein [Pseudomonadota bacterium]
GAGTAFNVDMNNRQLHPSQISRIRGMAPNDRNKQDLYAQVLCVLQNCDIDGLAGVDRTMNPTYQAGVQLLKNNPALFQSLGTDLKTNGLLSGDFAYAPGGMDFSKDAFGLKFQDSIYTPLGRLTQKPDNWGDFLTGVAQGASNTNPDLKIPYQPRNEDEARGAAWGAATALVGLTAVGAKSLTKTPVKVESVTVNKGTGSAVGNLEPGNPLSTSIPRAGDRVVLNQGQLPTCGPTSCGMVLNTAGIEVDVGVLISKSGVTSSGTTMPRLVKVLNDNGLPTQRVLGATVEDIAMATSRGDPAIVRMTLDRGGHAVVVDGVTIRNGQQVVAIRDPAGGRQYFTPIDEFRAKFSGEAAITKRQK